MKKQLIHDYLKYELEIKNFKIVEVINHDIASKNYINGNNLAIETYLVKYVTIGDSGDEMIITIGISLFDLLNFVYEHSQKLFFDKHIGAIGPSGKSDD